ncbi:reverse transcriptase [Corchorus capsularis]|uniref:Reverse transcriptase n=1 Tax=Corchorus capsularis TaxID=210143 RepID=A0A1R3GNW3_COCAP|nr:reverse transcriptase [Corchorus capsularis]
MAEALSDQMWKQLALTVEEEDYVSDDEPPSPEKATAERFWMVGRLHTERPFNNQAMIRTLKQVWRLVKAVSIIALENNLFLFKFATEADRNRPLGKRSLEMAEKMGKKMGTLIAVDPSLDMEGWACFLRKRVEIDVTKPLRRAIPIGKSTNGVRGRLAYERLPEFCFGCGRIGHCVIDCAEISDDPGQIQQYGDWLRASPLKPRVSGAGSRIPPVSESTLIRRDFAVNFDKSTGCRKALFQEEHGESSGENSPVGSQIGNNDKNGKFLIDGASFGGNHGKRVLEKGKLDLEIEEEAGRLNRALIVHDLGVSKIDLVEKIVNKSTGDVVGDLAKEAGKIVLNRKDFLASASKGQVGLKTKLGRDINCAAALGKKISKRGAADSEFSGPLTSKQKVNVLESDSISSFGVSNAGEAKSADVGENTNVVPPGAMIGVAWNCRGLGNPWTVRALRELIRRERPNVVFLMETKLPDFKLDSIRRRCKMHACFGVSATGRSGGLAMFWDDSVDLQLISFSQHHIDMWVDENQRLAKWRLTGFYGEADTGRRHLSWDLLRQFVLHDEKNWFCFGDFNELLWQAEKDGGRERPEAQMVAFREALDDCGLYDIGYRGNMFTWKRGMGNNEFIHERLDRGVATFEWTSRFPTACITHLSSSVSDHSPILLNTEVKQRRRKKQSCSCKQNFFEAGWCKEADCEKLVVDCWEFTDGLGLLDRIVQLRDSLGKKYDQQFRSLRERIDELSKKLNKISGVGGHVRNSEEVELREEINRLLEEEESFWLQWSRVNWLSEGDRNTSFFHAQASKRRKKNSIEQLEGENGRLSDDPVEIQDIASAYFKKLFISSGSKHYDEILEAVNPSITTEMNEHLLADFTAEEIFTALKQIHPTKAPGPDGMPVFFFKKFWHIVGSDVTSFCLDFFHGNLDLSIANKTHIVLIPKVDKPKNITQFRPISLCNVLYKIISKVLVNRLKSILPVCISESQSAFVPGRLITDNILVAFELLHSLKHRKTGKQGFFALKLDMSKAYDRVEWDFLEAIMLRMGFDRRWVELIMRCVRSVSFSVVVNGDVTDNFKPEHGLRQGDPLSPYLFLMCTEGLSALLSKGQTDGLLSGVSVSRTGPRVSHLFFADDSLLFGKANSAESGKVKDYLRIYEECSGQKINFEKSVVFFSRNIAQSDRDRVKAIFAVGEQSIIEKYLGLPTFVGRNKRSAFNWIKERIAKKIASWNMRWLSQGGREVMIKSVLQAIPTYAMNVFAFPQNLCNDINGMISRFWWKQRIDQRPIYWIPWRKLCKAKDFGGMGFRDMEFFNQALLAKQGWKLLHHPDSLMARVLKARYFPRTTFLEAKEGWLPSFTWRSILKGRDLLQYGLRWRIGNGRSVRILHDRWVAKLPGFIPFSGQGKIPDDSLVADLMHEVGFSWDGDLIRSIFIEEEAEAIVQIPLSYRLQNDMLVWHFDNKGIYSVKSGYRVLCNLQAEAEENLEEVLDDKPYFHRIWNADVPPKVRVFAWRLFFEALLVMDSLHARHMDVDRTCFRCKQENESVAHAICLCPFAAEVWCHVSNFFLNDDSYLYADIQDPDAGNLDQNPEWFRLSLLTAWAIWNARNATLFEEKFSRSIDTALFAFSYFKEFSRCRKAAAIQMPFTSPCWKPPATNFIKVNFDGAFDSTRQIGAYGLIARNSDGLVLGACSGNILNVSDAFVAESFAAVRALSWSREMGFSAVVIEGDALSIIRKINSLSLDFSPVGAYVKEAKSLKVLFSSCVVQHIGRNGNSVAHDLAKHGLLLDDEIVWMEDVPPWLHDSLKTDCIFSSSS